MTNEEILEIIERYKLRIPPTVYYDLLADVREVEEDQEPTAKNDLGVDCISRAEAIRVASGYCHPSNVAKELANLPSVTPQEPKTGHWIPSHIPESILDECSECGFSCGAFTFNYCPNCGAKMIEPQESEDNNVSVQEKYNK